MTLLNIYFHIYYEKCLLFQKRKIKLDRFVGKKVKISSLSFIGKQISLKIFLSSAEKNPNWGWKKIRFAQHVAERMELYLVGVSVKQIKYLCKIMTAVFNRHRMMTPPPFIILRRKMTLLPEECVIFII